MPGRFGGSLEVAQQAIEAQMGSDYGAWQRKPRVPKTRRRRVSMATNQTRRRPRTPPMTANQREELEDSQEREREDEESAPVERAYQALEAAQTALADLESALEDL